MATSQNGYTAAETTAGIPGGTVRITPKGAPDTQLTVRAGDVATVFQYLVDQYQARVEDIDLYTKGSGDDWGFAARTIRGSSTTLSNHMSATAIDLNATRHPLGTKASSNFTRAQIAAIHAILKELRGAVRWGGDYSGRPDPMHFEINVGKTKLKAVADAIKSGEIHPPSAEPPAWAFQATPVVELGPLVPDVLWQCAVTNLATGEHLVAIAKEEANSLFVRVSADGKTQLDSMKVLGTNAHQTEFGWLDDGTVTFSVNDGRGHDQMALPYRAGTFAARLGRSLHVGTDLPTQMAFSKTRKYAIIRVFEKGDAETFYRIEAAKVLGDAPVDLGTAIGMPVRIVPNDIPTQGFGSEGMDLFILKGGTDTVANPRRRYLERKSFTDGKHHDTQALDAVGPSDVSVEPEGMDGADFWLKCATGEKRRLCRYTHNLGKKP